MSYLDKLFSLEGRTALVTGARTGIGRAIAVALAGAGADVVLLGHGGDFKPVCEEIEAHGRNAAVATVDLGQPQEVAAKAQEILAEHQIDILVNNAGIIRRSDAVEHSYEDWRAVLSVNLDSVFELTKTVGAPMLQRQSGKVITIASLLSFQGGIRVAAYTASKHAVAGLTKTLANEWAANNVQVNAIAPGYVATDNTEALRADPRRSAEIVGRVPMGRWGSPDDLGGAAVFLAGSASDYVTGHVLAVDGGWLAR
ncbi:2-dehydro-3-deoxy-D-gluconate 5-dehydrogenase KduD [Kibdelosporangium philippinense]|uniref:2-dehydro-3-deoxy-D-gluconate 5-dehydrogenase KduD n=1 Tax=Kibdelosporangium philippinense TaxID=211113 RepID=A0ABS8ZWI0_9PSEU|nr:2-dehydro-3-deoxy-D-gluconate 5-dehydrogenase KduD [Kibdelosporangium philippinense]MCE7011623.1 2-dehydro-3-deoxy-D-gluconate 5-dehydrogenase KduD [Kibdelosporangium philippinense]